MKTSFRIVVACLCAMWGLAPTNAQPLWSSPRFPTDTSLVTVYYDASQGNGALAGVAPPIYAHTGVITNLSSSPTDWKYVRGSWRFDQGVFTTASRLPEFRNLFGMRPPTTGSKYRSVPISFVRLLMGKPPSRRLSTTAKPRWPRSGKNLSSPFRAYQESRGNAAFL